MNNTDLVCFGTYKQAKDYLDSHKTAWGDYICLPIFIADEKADMKFNRHFMIIDHFQSGYVAYVER